MAFPRLGAKGALLRLLRSSYLAAIVDQGVLSLSTFLVTIWMLKLLPPAEFGILALTAAVANLALVIEEAVAATPLSVRLPALRSPLGQGLLMSAIGNVLYVLFLVLLLAALLAIWLTDLSAALVLAAAAYVGGVALRGFLRSAAYAHGATRLALGTSVTLLAGSLAGVGLLVAFDLVTLPRALAVMAVMQVLPGLAGMIRRFGRPPRPSWRSLRRYRHIWPDTSWSLFGVGVNFTQRQSHAAIVPTLSSPAAFAPLAASETLFGPMRLVMLGMAMVMRPQMARMRAADDRRGMKRVAVRTLIIVAAVNAAVLLGMVAAWPWIFQLLFAGKYPEIAVPVICAGIITVLVGLRTPVSVVFQVHREFRAVAMADTGGAITSLLATLLILLTLGSTYALLGVVLGEIACLSALLLRLRPMLRHQRAAPA